MPSIGDKFNKFTIISQASAKSFMCQCVCGNMRKLYVSDMARESCGCLQTQQKKINVGDKFQTSLGGTVVVTKYTHANDITVVFENTGYERTTTSGNLQKGKVLDKSIKRVNPEKAKDINFFLAKATEVHGSLYDYSKTEYVASNIPLEIVCPIHGMFEQTPSNHYAGNGCPACGGVSRAEKNMLDLSSFLEKARAIHGDRYIYTNSVYNGAKQKLKIECTIHGEFQQKASAHWEGSGCPECGKQCGFKTTLPATLYIMSSGELTKVGITNKKVSIRARDVSKSSGQDFRVVREFKMHGLDALNLETVTLQQLSKQYQKALYKFDGSTECFIDVDIPVLILEIESRIGSIIRERENGKEEDKTASV